MKFQEIIENKRNEYFDLINKANTINTEMSKLYLDELKRFSGLWNPNTDDIEDFPYSFINKYDNEVNVAVVGVFVAKDELFLICYTDEDEVLVLDQYRLELKFDDLGEIYNSLEGLKHDLEVCLETSLIERFLHSYTDFNLTKYTEIKFNHATYRMPIDLIVNEKALYLHINKVSENK